MKRVDILITVGCSTVSCAIGALVAHKRTKKKLTAFFEKQVEIEVTAALHIQAEKLNDVQLAPYKGVGLLIEDEAEKPVEVPEELVRKDGNVAYHLVSQRDSARHTVISGGVLTKPTEPVEEVNELDFADLEMVARENLLRKEQDLPHAITYEECTDDVEGYVSVQLVYYVVDGVLADYVHEVHDIADVIDEFNLNLFGYLADGEVVYIRNPKKKLLIEVARDPGSFAEAKA